MNRRLGFSVMALWLIAVMRLAAVPQPGEVYREYVTTIGGNDWRVTNPAATAEGAQAFLPNPVLTTPEISLAGAVRVEAELDVWGGHLRTVDRVIRFNGGEWLAVPRPVGSDGAPLSPLVYSQHIAVIDVPLAQLQSGENTFEGSCDHQFEGGWGQWGINALTLRVYYDPATVEPAVGRIVSPTSGGVFRENPIIDLEVSSEVGISRVEVIGWYEGFDENGDGVTRDWHEANFAPARGEAPVRSGHVGTAVMDADRVAWGTRWLPDQAAGAIKLVARIRDHAGLWTVTEVVEDLTLERLDFTVSLNPLDELPLAFGIRQSPGGLGFRQADLTMGEQADLPRAIEAGMHYRTWNGWDGWHEPFSINDWSHPNEGRNHFYDYDFISVPLAALQAGQNVFTITSDTEEHALEVLAPGPVVAVRSRTATLPAEANTSRLTNLSVRLRAAAADDRLIVGMVAAGQGSHQILMRAVGPGLREFGVAGVMEELSLALLRGSETVAANERWFEAENPAALAQAADEVGAFALDETSPDAAILAALETGPFTVHVAGEEGVVLAETYDERLSATPGWRIMNLSARGPVASGEDTPIAGFVIAGSNPMKVLVRAVGPSLAEYGVADTIADPQLTLFRSSEEIASNDDWGADPVAQSAAERAGAFPLTSSKDAALVVMLSPGAYTVHLENGDGGTGIALVEVYEVP